MAQVGVVLDNEHEEELNERASETELLHVDKELTDSITFTTLEMTSTEGNAKEIDSVETDPKNACLEARVVVRNEEDNPVTLEDKEPETKKIKDKVKRKQRRRTQRKENMLLYQRQKKRLRSKMWNQRMTSVNYCC